MGNNDTHPLVERPVVRSKYFQSGLVQIFFAIGGNCHALVVMTPPGLPGLITWPGQPMRGVYGGQVTNQGARCVSTCATTNCQTCRDNFLSLLSTISQ